MFQAIEFTEKQVRLVAHRAALFGTARTTHSIEEAEKMLERVANDLARDRQLLAKAKELEVQSGQAP